MVPMTLSEIADAAAGRLRDADPAAVVAAVEVDSRAIGPGGLFVALRGSRDGHDFVGDAFRAGAIAAVVSGERAVAGAGPAVLVDDTLAALGRIAAAARRRLGARVVAVTGSSGKTLTKELAAAAIGTRRRVVASPRSFNNEIGVPLTVLAAGEDTEVVVAEVGSRGPGHIAALVPVLRPDVAVVTNVGVAHIGEFGSREAIARAKGELVEALGPGGTAVLNADDPAVSAMRSLTSAAVITFGLGEGADVRATGVALDADALPSFRVNVHTPAVSGVADVHLRVPGEHMVPNALAAIAAAAALGIEVADAARGAGEARGAPWRMEVVEARGGWRVINDAYNANPASMAAALRTLVAMGKGRRTWAVVGEMAELGVESEAEHDRIGRLAARLGVRRLVVVGEAARPALEAARLECMTPEEAVAASGADDAADAVLREIAPGDVVLVKASRAVGLERVAERLVEGA